MILFLQKLCLSRRRLIWTAARGIEEANKFSGAESSKEEKSLGQSEA